MPLAPKYDDHGSEARFGHEGLLKRQDECLREQNKMRELRQQQLQMQQQQQQQQQAQQADSGVSEKLPQQGDADDEVRTIWPEGTPTN